VVEAKNQLHAAVIPSGHIFARRSAGASLSLPGHRDEQWHGRTQLQFLTRLAEEFAAAGDDLVERISHLKALLFRRGGLTVNLTGDGEALAVLRQEMEGLVHRCAEGGPGTATVPPDHPGTRLGVAIPAQVSYVAQVMAAPTYGNALAVSLFVAARHLSSGYLYQHIRVQGGAYGGMANYDLPGGLFAFLSYRDPRLVETLQVYRDAILDMAEHGISGEELDKAVLGSIAALDKPMDPAGKGHAALLRAFAGVTDELRRAFRNDILGMTSAVLEKSAVPFFLQAAESAAVAVYADGEKLAEANKTLRPELTVASLVP
jgi:presequence protease